MTNSQVYAWVGAVASIIFTVGTAVLPHLQDLPPEGRKWLTVVSAIVAACGALVALFNQSASRAHVSIPVAEAKAKGIAPKQTGAFEGDEPEVLR